MKRVCMLGHFAFGVDKANGQTIKAKILATELKQQIGDENVDLYDTMGGWRFVMRMPFVLLKMLRNYQHVVIQPAYKGVRVIVPCLVLFNLFFHRKLHYIVLGGWLPSFVKKYPILRWSLKRLDVMYTETHLIQQELQALGLNPIYYLPNCKKLDIVKESELPTDSQAPYKVCTFSRITKTKGIIEAIEAVRRINEQKGKILYQLDIYGLIEDKAWFEQLMKDQPEYIRYGGIIAYNDSVRVLRNYFVLLFPSYHAGEGLAASLIDALAAGLPPIVTRWRSNAEVITDGETGFLIEPHSVDVLVEKMMLIAKDPALVDRMRPACIRHAERFLPSTAIQPLLQQLD